MTFLRRMTQSPTHYVDAELNPFDAKPDVPLEVFESRYIAPRAGETFLTWGWWPVSKSAGQVRRLGREYWDAQRPRLTADDTIEPQDLAISTLVRRERILKEELDRVAASARHRRIAAVTLSLVGPFIVSGALATTLMFLVTYLYVVCTHYGVVYARAYTARLSREVGQVHAPAYEIAFGGPSRFPFAPQPDKCVGEPTTVL